MKLFYQPVNWLAMQNKNPFPYQTSIVHELKMEILRIQSSKSHRKMNNSFSIVLIDVRKIKYHYIKYVVYQKVCTLQTLDQDRQQSFHSMMESVGIKLNTNAIG